MLILKTPTSLNIIGKVQIMKVMREREEKTAFNFTVIVKKEKHTFSTCLAFQHNTGYKIFDNSSKTIPDKNKKFRNVGIQKESVLKKIKLRQAWYPNKAFRDKLQESRIKKIKSILASVRDYISVNKKTIPVDIEIFR